MKNKTHNELTRIIRSEIKYYNNNFEEDDNQEFELTKEEKKWYIAGLKDAIRLIKLHRDRI